MILRSRQRKSPGRSMMPHRIRIPGFDVHGGRDGRGLEPQSSSRRTNRSHLTLLTNMVAATVRNVGQYNRIMLTSGADTDLD